MGLQEALHATLPCHMVPEMLDQMREKLTFDFAPFKREALDQCGSVTGGRHGFVKLWLFIR